MGKFCRLYRVAQRNGFVEGSIAYGYVDYDMARYVFIPDATFSGFDSNADPADGVVDDVIVLDSMFRRTTSCDLWSQYASKE